MIFLCAAATVLARRGKYMSRYLLLDAPAATAVILSTLLFLAFLTYKYNAARWDPLCSTARCDFRKRCFFEEGFLRAVEDDWTPEESFEELEVYAGAPASSSRRVLSYSLYGTEQKYFEHLLNNADFVRAALPGWVLRVYAHEPLAGTRVDYLSALASKGADVRLVRDAHAAPGNSAGAFWRFLPLWENGVDCVVLDADDVLDQKQADMWHGFFAEEPAGTLLSTFGSDPWPLGAIQARGIWKRSAFSPRAPVALLHSYPHRSTFGADEAFLAVYLPVGLLDAQWRRRDMSGSIDATIRKWSVRDTVASPNPRLLSLSPTRAQVLEEATERSDDVATN